MYKTHQEVETRAGKEDSELLWGLAEIWYLHNYIEIFALLVIGRLLLIPFIHFGRRFPRLVWWAQFVGDETGI